MSAQPVDRPDTPTMRMVTYRPTMHYSTAQEGVWIGWGHELHARCGQSEWIATVDPAGLVTCLKCLAAIERSGG